MQLDLHRSEQLIAHPQGMAAGMPVRVEAHAALHAGPLSGLPGTGRSAETEDPRTGNGTVAIADHALGIDVAVNGQGTSRDGQKQQQDGTERSQEHGGSGVLDIGQASLAAPPDPGEARRAGA